MKVLTILIYIIISLLVSTILIAASLNILSISAVLNFPQQQHLFTSPFDYYTNVIILSAGLLLFLLSLRYLLHTLIYSRRSKGIGFELTNGKVSITFSAIEDLLKKVLENRKELSHIQPKVFLTQKGKEITVIIRSNLTTEINLKDLSQDIQESIKEKMQFLLGDEKDIAIIIEIRKMEASGKKKTEEFEPPVPPFRIY